MTTRKRQGKRASSPLVCRTLSATGPSQTQKNKEKQKRGAVGEKERVNKSGERGENRENRERRREKRREERRGEEKRREEREERERERERGRQGDRERERERERERVYVWVVRVCGMV